MYCLMESMLANDDACNTTHTIAHSWRIVCLSSPAVPPWWTTVLFQVPGLWWLRHINARLTHSDTRALFLISIITNACNLLRSLPAELTTLFLKRGNSSSRASSPVCLGKHLLIPPRTNVELHKQLGFMWICLPLRLP